MKFQSGSPMSRSPAYYGEIDNVFEKYAGNGFDARQQSAEAALRIDQLVADRVAVDWVHNDDIQNRMKTDIEDYLFSLKDETGIPLTLEDIDQILDRCINIARAWRAQ